MKRATPPADTALPSTPPSGTPPHILVFNWKDMRHPQRGGAEVYTDLVLKGLRSRGYRVTLYVPRGGAPAEETSPEGVRVLRRGNRLTYLFYAFRFLVSRRNAVDLVIDETNGYLFSHLVVPPRQGVLLIHQLIGRVWFYQMPAPWSVFGYLLEPLLLLPYRRWTSLTVSASTAADLGRLGFRDIEVVENALAAVPAFAPREPPQTSHFVALGRLVPMKRFEHVLEAFKIVKRTLPEARLTVVGRGGTKYAARLERTVNAVEGATLLPDASETLKQEVLAGATAVVATSVREGWGLMISEGHALGTPSVAYRLPGLQDSTLDGVTGLLTDPNPDALARAMLELHADPARWRVMSVRARQAATLLTTQRLQDRVCAIVAAKLAWRSAAE